MSQLAARDALTSKFKRVNLDERPGFDASSVFAVFESDEPNATLVGLVTPDRVANLSQRIFADLLPELPGIPISADLDLEAIAVQMDTLGASALPVLDRGGHLLGVVTRESLWAAMLIQQRALAAELAAREAQQTAILNAIPDDLLCVNAEGRMLRLRQPKRVDDGGNVVARPLELADSNGKTVADVFPADVSATLKQGIEQSRVSGRSGHASFCLPGAGGTTLQYDAQFVAWGEGRVLIVCRDVTEVNVLRGKLIQTDRMLSIGTLAAGVAHEINNPLTYVATNIGLLADMLVPEMIVDDFLRDAKPLVDDIRDGVDRVQRTVRDLKLFSRSEDVVRTPVDLKQVITRILRIADNEIRHRATLSLDLGDIPLVDGNDGQLGQVLLNLLVNAAQSIGEGAADRNQIRVVTRTDRRGCAVVEVHDTGSGIPDDIKARIFAPFFTTKDVGAGTGIGLSICQSIIAAHDGDIQVDSTVGRGSVFRIILPMSKVGSPVAVKPVARLGAVSAVRPPGRFLVVDDEPIILKMYRHLLGTDQCTTCSSGRLALKLIERGERFDAILCDLMMPDTSGMDVHDELVRVAPDQAARMIFVTGGGFTERSRRFAAERADRILEKPFKRTALFDCLTQVIKEQGAIPPTRAAAASPP